MIKLVRIDYRLLHGRWFLHRTRALDIDHIIVANAKAAADAFITMSLNWQSQRASRWTSPPLNRRRKSLTAASWIIKSHGGPRAILRKPSR